MKKEELLLQDWKECMENIRFFRDQINKMSLWEFAPFPSIGIAIALKFIIIDGNFLYSGITFILLSFILGFVDNLNHINARYSLICIKIAQDIEKELGTSLSRRIKEKWMKDLKMIKNIFSEDIICSI
ncbi:hypothetical protein J7L49_04125 [Candidatus Bathyarchaeota archaeon]|nr:hypothetical protein [Candidatus Bathyarchaeota archaeon]